MGVRSEWNFQTEWISNVLYQPIHSGKYSNAHQCANSPPATHLQPKTLHRACLGNLHVSKQRIQFKSWRNGAFVSRTHAFSQFIGISCLIHFLAFEPKPNSYKQAMSCDPSGLYVTLRVPSRAIDAATLPDLNVIFLLQPKKEIRIPHIYIYKYIYAVYIYTYIHWLTILQSPSPLMQRASEAKLPSVFWLTQKSDIGLTSGIFGMGCDKQMQSSESMGIVGIV